MNIFVASEVRSGSTMFCETLSYSFNASFEIEFWDIAKEHFSHLNYFSEDVDILDTLNSLWINQAGYRSAKLMCRELSIIWSRSIDNIGLREYFFGPDSKWIVIRRKDRLAQAVSLAEARNSGIYHSYEDEGAVVEMEDPNSKISDALRSIILSDQYLEVFQSNVPGVVSICYEDFILSPREYLVNIIESFAIPVDPMELKIESPKLTPRASAQKRSLRKGYEQWFLANNFDVPDEYKNLT